MKKIGLIIASFLMWAMFTGMIAGELQKQGIAPVITTAAMFVLTIAGVLFAKPAQPGMVSNDVNVSVWAREIIKRFWKENKFLQYAFSEDQYVVGGAAVLIPNPGTRSPVTKNRSSYPAVAVRRSDSTVMYELDEYTTDPVHIPNVELETISYDKTSSIIEDLFGGLIQDVADDMLIKWLTSLQGANVVNTTGPLTAALESGQTGNRLGMRWQDLRQAAQIMNKANAPKDGRVALLEENMYQQLVDSVASTQYKDFDRSYDPATGVIGRLMGFDIMTRSSVAVAADALDGGGLMQVNAFEASIGATDDVVSMCWHRNSVSRALGTTKLYQRMDDPLYYGNVFSTSLRMGGRVRRADNVGIVAIKQAMGASN